MNDFILKNTILNIKITTLDFTFLAIFSCILGVNFSLRIWGFQLSLYRLLLVVAPFFLFVPAYNRLIKHKRTNGIIFIVFLFVWLIYSLITGIWVVDYLSWIKYVFFLLSALLFSTLIFANINTSNAFIKSIRIVVFVSMSLSVLAFYESITGNYFFLDESSLEWYQDISLLHKASFFREPITVFGNPNNYALFLFYSFGFTIFLLLIEKSKIFKLAYAIFLFITVFLVIITLSRSALIGIGLLIFVLSLFVLFKGSKSLRYRLLLILVGIGLLVGQLLINYSYFIDGFFLLEFGKEGSSDAIRTNLILNGFKFLTNTYFLGTGLGNIEFYMATKKAYDVGGIVNLHNWWMEILISSGILIFIFYLSLYINTFFRLYNRIGLKKEGDFFWMNVIFAGLFVGFIFSSVGPSSLMECEWFWPLMALTFKSSYIQDN